MAAVYGEYQSGGFLRQSRGEEDWLDWMDKLFLTSDKLPRQRACRWARRTAEKSGKVH